MLRHNYAPKVKAFPTASDYQAECERYRQMMAQVSMLKKECTAKLKALRREMLAKKAWLIRYQYLSNPETKQSSAVGAAVKLSPEELALAQRRGGPLGDNTISDSEREALEKAMLATFGPCTA
jgi:hypothetical protein